MASLLTFVFNDRGTCRSVLQIAGVVPTDTAADALIPGGDTLSTRLDDPRVAPSDGGDTEMGGVLLHRPFGATYGWVPFVGTPVELTVVRTAMGPMYSRDTDGDGWGVAGRDPADGCYVKYGHYTIDISGAGGTVGIDTVDEVTCLITQSIG